MTSCATASIAYAVCTCSSRRSTEGHNARRPPSRGGVKSPATTIERYATGSGSVPEKAKTAIPRAETSAAGNWTRGCPYRSTSRPSSGCPTALPTPYTAASAPARLYVPPSARTKSTTAMAAVALGSRPVSVPASSRAACFALRISRYPAAMSCPSGNA